MCFSSKAKTPKVDPNAIQAPTPVLAEEPKGVEFGDGASDDTTTGTETDGTKGLKVERDKGDGTGAAVSKDTGIAKKPTLKKTGSSAVKRALKR